MTAYCTSNPAHLLGKTIANELYLSAHDFVGMAKMADPDLILEFTAIYGLDPSVILRKKAGWSKNGLQPETSLLFYTQIGSTDDPFQLHGPIPIHRVSDIPQLARLNHIIA